MVINEPSVVAINDKTHQVVAVGKEAKTMLGKAPAHIRDVRRRLRGVDELIVQIDEPALAAVMNAQVPTASGFGRHRSIYHPSSARTAT